LLAIFEKLHDRMYIFICLPKVFPNYQLIHSTTLSFLVRRNSTSANSFLFWPTFCGAQVKILNWGSTRT
jgi:hypothetical protein